MRAMLALLLCLICAAAIFFFYVSPVNTGDARADALLDASIPRFFISVFLLVLIAEFFPCCLSRGRISLKVLLWCIPPFAVTVVNFPFSALVGGTAGITRPDLIGLFLLKCFLIGLSEELLFRGIVFGVLNEAFVAKRRSAFFPVLLSSAIFALFHFINLLDGAGILPVLQQVGYSFLIGAMLAVVLVKTKNLWLCVLLHALFDVGGCFLSDIGIGSPHDTVFWILTVSIGVLCAVHIAATLFRQVKKIP